MRANSAAKFSSHLITCLCSNDAKYIFLFWLLLFIFVLTSPLPSIQKERYDIADDDQPPTLARYLSFIAFNTSFLLFCFCSFLFCSLIHFFTFLALATIFLFFDFFAFRLAYTSPRRPLLLLFFFFFSGLFPAVSFFFSLLLLNGFFYFFFYLYYYLSFLGSSPRLLGVQWCSIRA